MKSIPGFKVLEKIGEGGMGAVYKAVDERTGRVVALKVLDEKLAKDEEYVRRFHREARSAAALNHRNLTRVMAEGKLDKLHFIVMEFVDGRTVADMVLEEGPFPPEAALAVIRQAAEGLAHAHSRGVIHRDIKPENIMLTNDGTVKITDMGLAKRLGSRSEESQITLVGTILGTPRYMAPEQIRSPDKVDHRADIWALGVTLYFLLTARTPFDGATALDTLHNVLKKPIRYPPAIPLPIQRLLRRILSKDPNRRIQTCDELIEAIDQTVRELSRHTTISDRVRKPSLVARGKESRSIVPVAAIAAVLVGILFVIVLLSVRPRRPKTHTPSRTPNPPTTSHPPSTDPIKDFRAWFAKHRDDWVEAYRRLMRIKQEAPSFSRDVEAELESLKGVVRKALSDAVEEARRAIRRGRFFLWRDALAQMRVKITVFPDLLRQLNSAINDLDKFEKREIVAHTPPLLRIDFSKPVVIHNIGFSVSEGRFGKDVDGWALMLRKGGKLTLDLPSLSDVKFLGLVVEGKGVLRLKDGDKIEPCSITSLSFESEVVVIEALSEVSIKCVKVFCLPHSEEPEVILTEDDFDALLTEMAKLIASGKFTEAFRLAKSVVPSLPPKGIGKEWSDFVGRLGNAVADLPSTVTKIASLCKDRVYLRDGKTLKGGVSVDGVHIVVNGERLGLHQLHPSLLRGDNLICGLLGGELRERLHNEGGFVSRLLARLGGCLPSALFGERIGKYAVIITGASFNALQSHHYLKDNIRFALMLRKIYGFPPEAIWRLCEGGVTATICASAKVTRDNIKRVFQYLSRVAGPDDEIVVFIVGASDGHRLALEDGLITAEEFAELLKPLKSKRVAFVMQFGGSGKFGELLGRRGWVVLASSRAGEPAAAGWIGGVRKALEKGATFYEAFKAGCDVTSDFYAKRGLPQAQHPFIAGEEMARKWRLGGGKRLLDVVESAVRREALERARMVLEGSLPTEEDGLWSGFCGFVREWCAPRDFAEALARAGSRVSRAHLLHIPTLLYFGRHSGKGLSESLGEVRRLAAAVYSDAAAMRDSTLLSKIVWAHFVAARIEGSIPDTLRRIERTGVVGGWKRGVIKAALLLEKKQRNRAADLLSDAVTLISQNRDGKAKPSERRIAQIRRAFLRKPEEVKLEEAEALLRMEPLRVEGWAALSFCSKGVAAREYAAAALILDPKNALGYLAMAHAVREDPEAALLWLAAAEKRGLNETKMYLRRFKKRLLEDKYRRERRLDEVIKKAKELLETDPLRGLRLIESHLTMRRVETFSLWARLLQRAGLLQRAVKALYLLEVMTEERQATAAPLFIAGTIMLKQIGNPKSALEIFKFGESLFEKRNGCSSKVWWLMMADCYRRLGDEQAAQRSLERAKVLPE